MLLPIFALSGFAAYQAAENLGKETSLTQAAVIHRGLPGVPGPTIYEPLGPKTCSELLTSVKVLSDVLAKRGLEMPVSAFQELILVELTRNSSLMNIELTWGDPQDGISLLNDLLDEFIEYVASERRATLREHIKHVEIAQLEAKSAVDLARTRTDELRRRQQQRVIASGGYTDDFYKGLLSDVSNTRYAIEDERALKLGMDQQIKLLDQKLEEIEQTVATLEEGSKETLLRETVRRLALVRDGFASNSVRRRDLDELIEGLGSIEVDGVNEWYTALTLRLTDSNARLSRSVLEELSLAHEPILANHEERLGDAKQRVREIERSKENLQLRMFPLGSQISALEQRLGSLESESQDAGDPLGGFDASRIDEAESELADAEAHQQALGLQLANMRQLEKCRVNEWVITVPASRNTTKVTSNRTKIGALAFALCSIGLCLPLVLAEWVGRREPPEVAFARTMGLPLAADGVMGGFRRTWRGYNGLDDLPPSSIEAVRRFALRIQQSCHRTDRGATIVFSSLDPGASAVPLMAAIAECLADREERVLLVNTAPADRVTCWIAEAPSGGDKQSKRKALEETARSAGLAEYLSAECSELDSLIHPTGLPGVDAIFSGDRPFPREAMASSCLAKLLATCSERYSMVLVNGPAAKWSADLQMLAAHADGIVLTATKRISNGAEAREAVADLIDLQAPIIGVVS